MSQRNPSALLRTIFFYGNKRLVVCLLWKRKYRFLSSVSTSHFLSPSIFSLLSCYTIQLQFTILRENWASVCQNDALDKKRYRLFSILPRMSKIFEGVIIDHLSPFLENVYSPYVSGFSQNRDCQNVPLCHGY